MLHQKRKLEISKGGFAQTDFLPCAWLDITPHPQIKRMVMHWQTMRVCQCIQQDNCLLEFVWELSEDAFCKHACHMQDLVVNFIVRYNIAIPIPIQTRHRLVQG